MTSLTTPALPDLTTTFMHVSAIPSLDRLHRKDVLNLEPLIVMYTTRNGFIGIRLNCQPQNCQLVDNPEIGNSEYIQYSELPTLLITVYLVYLMISKYKL